MNRRVRLASLLLALAAAGGVALGARCASATQASCSLATLTGAAPRLDVPYAGTRPETVRLMLDMAQVGPGDRVIDLGTGEGRILLAAAARGANGLGVDIDPVLIAQARAESVRRGLSRQVTFRVENLFRTSLRDADVVTMFLLPEVNLRLRPRILSQMRPGARVVSHAFDMADWPADAQGRAGGARVYLWRVPARVAGRWRVTTPGRKPMLLTLTQRHQSIAGTLGGEPLSDARLSGDRLTFSAEGRRYKGTVREQDIIASGWRAERLTAPLPLAGGAGRGTEVRS